MANYRKQPDLSVLRFDAEKSLRAGLEILREAHVPFALAGRLAVWCYVPEEAHGFTKDADFAVPYGRTRELAVIASARGYRVKDLDIGGCGVKSPGIAVDFIHRHPALSRLFADAVKAARRQRKRLKIADFAVPVVPRDYLICMKLAIFDAKDDRDVTELLKVTPAGSYRRLRSLVAKYHGFVGVQRLDQLARAAGHPGPAALKKRYDRAQNP
jgi:hypothetical protein